ncbi:MAG: class 1 fructose-bisphosphatase, partial [Acidobacteria bacterium]
LYPADRRHPEGKLRLLYEAGPMAFLFRQARGAESDGSGSLLERAPRTLHDRTPVLLGGERDVKEFLARRSGTDPERT